MALFSLGRPGAVLHSDAAKGFIAAASMYDLKHLLCSKHYHRKIEQLHSSLGSKYKSFSDEVMELIYNVKNISEFERRLSQLQADFADHDGATKLLEDLNRRKASLCAAYTLAYYTAGHRATQRAEGLFAALKRNRSKFRMRRWHHMQLLDRLLSHLKTLKMRAMDELSKLIADGKWCTDSITTSWTKQNDMAGRCAVETNSLCSRAACHYILHDITCHNVDNDHDEA